jgi:threonine/homoserine/homoserine lactone efflux protein
MMIPITMVLLSRILKYRASRWASIIAGTIMTITLALTLFVAVPTTYYAFFTAIEIACTALIVWLAWTWRNPESSSNNIALAEGKSA